MTFIKATLWTWQQNATDTVAIDEIWSESLMAVWGQCVGFLVALVYIVQYLPLRKSVMNASPDLASSQQASRV